MSAKTEGIIRSLRESLRRENEKKTSGYDTRATIRRIEDRVAWVHIPGGVDETPVTLTIGANVGDEVQVRVSGGRAFLVGNATAPPTNDKYARQVNYNLGQQIEQTNVVMRTINRAVQAVKKIADNTNQYFWHTEEGTDTGAHITEIPQEEFLADPENGGGNLLARSNGIAVRDGLTELAQFSADGVQIGQDGETHAEVTDRSFELSDGERTVFDVSATDATYKRELDVELTEMRGNLYRPAVGLIDGTLYTSDSLVILPELPTGTKAVLKFIGWPYSKLRGYEKTVYVGTTMSFTDSPTGATITYDGARTVLMSGVDSSTDSSLGMISVRYVDTSQSAPSYTFGSRTNVYDSNDNEIPFGANSATSGSGLISTTQDQSVFGAYNIHDDNDYYAMIVGNGTSDSDRSNAFTVDWKGNILSGNTHKVPCVLPWTFENQTAAANTRGTLRNLSVPSLPSSATVLAVCVTSTPNRHWIWASAYANSDNTIGINYVNEYNGAISGNFTVLIFFTL